MMLEQIFFTSQSVAAAGVIASLIFVGLQVRGSTKAVRSATAQAVHENFANWFMAIAGRPADLEIVLKGSGDLEALTTVERAVFNCIFLAFTSHAQNAFHQWREGHLANELWTCWEFLLSNMIHTKGGVAVWRERSYVFAEEFRVEVEALAQREPHVNAKAFGVLPLSRTDDGRSGPPNAPSDGRRAGCAAIGRFRPERRKS
jgi:hypothetical protein